MILSYKEQCESSMSEIFYQKIWVFFIEMYKFQFFLIQVFLEMKKKNRNFHIGISSTLL